MAYFLPGTGQYANPGMYSSNPGIDARYQSPLGRYATAYEKVASASVWLGSLLIVCGCISIAGAVMAIVFNADWWYLGTGFWCGAVFVSTGSVAIAAGQHLTDSLIIGTTVTSAFTVALGITQVALAALSLAYDLYSWRCPYEYYYSYDCYCYYDGYSSCYSNCYGGYWRCYNWYWKDYAIAADSMLIGAGSAALIFGFSLFIIGCRIVSNAPQQLAPMQIPMPTMQYMSLVHQQPPFGGFQNQQMVCVPLGFLSNDPSQQQQQQQQQQQPPLTFSANQTANPVILNPAGALTEQHTSFYEPDEE